MSSGSRVRREGTIAMSSNPYARRRLLAASDLYFHRLHPCSPPRTRGARSRGLRQAPRPRDAGNARSGQGASSRGPRLGRVRTALPMSLSSIATAPCAPRALGYARIRLQMTETTRPQIRPAGGRGPPPGGVARARRRSATPALPTSSRTSTSSPRRRSPPGNIHIGHVRSYSIGDAYARFRRARGDDVLFAFGFDAFGLPAELGAIASGESPSEWVNRCAAHMTGQLERLGFSFDWERSFLSSDPVMYRWSQWLFLTLLEAGLIYRGTGNVDWCDNCQTTLASIQVEPGGTCWRCHEPGAADRAAAVVPARSAPTCAENDARLAELEASGNWDEVALASQQYRARARRRRRARPARRPRRRLADASSRPTRTRSAQARFVLISPRHPDVETWAADAGVARAARAAALGRLGAQLPRGRDDPGDRHRPRRCSAPAARALPVLVSPLVDSRFGATAVLGVPAQDRSRRGDRAAARARARATTSASRRAGCAAPARRAVRPAVHARRSATAPPTSRSPASARGERRSRSSTASGAAPCRCRASSCRCCCRSTSPRPGTGNPLAELEEFVQHDLSELRRPGPARDRHARLPLRRAVAVDPGVRARRRRARSTLEEILALPGPAPLAALRAPGGGLGQRQLRVRPADRRRRRCATSGRWRSWPTASRSRAACSTRW